MIMQSPAQPSSIPRRRPLFVRRHPVALALASALAALAPSAGAATIQVITADDAGTSSTCTLRQAIASMNAASVAPSSSCTNSGGSFGATDTITFADDVTSVELADLANNELLITDSLLTIRGTGTGGITVSRVTGAVHPFRIFHDTAAAAGNGLYLSGLTISNGATTASSAKGGAIFMDNASNAEGEIVVLTNCMISGNSTSGANAVGGAIAAGNFYNDGTVRLISSTISGNSTSGASSGGGAIYATHQTYMQDSIVTGNSTTGPNSAGGAIRTLVAIANMTTLSDNSTLSDDSGGGAIATFGGSGSIEGIYDSFIGNSTAGNNSPGGAINTLSAQTMSYFFFSDNSTAGDGSSGGAIYALHTTLEGSTISGNTVSGNGSNGGGIYSRKASLGSSTVSDNAASGELSSGGGIWLLGGTLSNSTVSGNIASVGGGGINVDVCTVSSPSLTMYNSTIAFNATAVGGAGAYFESAGCTTFGAAYSVQTSAAVKASSSILSNTTVASADGVDVSAETGIALTINTSFDLIQRPPSGAGITVLNAAGSPALISSDPKLIPLADNGCGVKSGAPDSAMCMPTHAITGCSLAHDAGTNPLILRYDERGSEFPRIAGIAADIGAYELEPNGDDIFCNGFQP